MREKKVDRVGQQQQNKNQKKKIKTITLVYTNPHRASVSWISKCKY